ncbi:S-layer homology domain-containing protein [Paenibacillus oceani]|uniref:S-layer homology domain-containing protein n=1 Tax=Paenibacillus oceani TaxID=2772510 RepID=A0A927CD42_9BACL|nr:S-layer homology domain-containing protein [Paenibacillus oceani]MBD2863620.1 S-layer homology domain-containing protein [Paenibacillus oceani]
MSNKSLQIKLNSQTSNVNRGGEKKVMKKSLSVLVATAMVSSMFASVAFAAELTTQEKLDALIAAGIFDKDGTGQGSELEANMSREQLAKIVALLKKLEVQSGTSYTDVAADRWSAGFIQAVSKVKPMIMDGVADGVFDPSGDVTLEQLATVAVRALGLTVKTDAEVKGDVSDWAKGYVATAVANGLLPDAANTDFTKPAIRAQLVEATYAAKEVLDELVKPAKVSVKEAKAVGVQKVEVTLDRDVDTSKAKLTLKRGSTELATDVKWADDKKSAVLTLKDGKLIEANYSVTISNLGEGEIDKATAEFSAQKEVVKSIDFVNSNDTIAQSKKARVQIVAKNQYDEAVSLSAGSFTANTPGFTSNLTKDGDYLVLTIDTLRTSPNETIPGQTIIPVYITENESRVMTSKNFKLGTKPFVTKIELQDVKYGSGKTSLSSKGDTAIIPLTQYDQFGNPVAYDDTDAIVNIYTNVNPYNEDIKAEYGDYDNNNFGEIRVSLQERIDKSGDYTVNVYAGGSSATATVKVSSAKVANKVEFGDYNDVLAERDTDKYIPVIAYDEQGNKLSLDDLVDSVNLDRIRIGGSGVAYAPKLVKSGEHKGKIHVTRVNATEHSVAVLTLSITEPGVNDYKTKQFQIGKVRYPDRLKVTGEPAKKIFNDGTAAVTSDVTVKVYDQYEQELKEIKPVDPTASTLDRSVRENNKTVEYAVYVYTQADVGTSNLSVTARSTNASAPTFAPSGTYYTADVLSTFNDGHKFNSAAGAVTGKMLYGAKIVKREVGTTDWVDATSPTTRSIQAITDSAELMYSITSVSSLFAAQDSKLLTDAQKDPATSKLAKKITVSAKDGAGDTVAISTNRVMSVTGSTYDVVVTKESGGNAFILGNKKGNATVTVNFRDIKGIAKSATLNVEVKDDAVSVASMSANTNFKSSTVTHTFLRDYMALKPKDNYGNEYGSQTDITAYDNLLGVRYIVEDAVNAAGNAVAVIYNSTTGEVTNLNGAVQFTVKATAGSGVSKSTHVDLR